MTFPLTGCTGGRCKARYQCEQYSVYLDCGKHALKGTKTWKRNEHGLIECLHYLLDPTVEDLTPKEPEGEQLELF